MSQQTIQQYFEPLRNIHNREYPIPQLELQSIVEQTMAGLELAVERVRGIRDRLAPEEQARADSFLFYLVTLKEADVSPISVRTFTDYRSGSERLGYGHDIAFEEGHTDLNFGWLHTDSQDDVPRLDFNNLWCIFALNQNLKQLGDKAAENYLAKSVADEHLKESLLKKYRSGELLEGDIQFASSESKMRYIDLHGNEVTSDKTPYRAWEEFKAENPQLMHRLTELTSSYTPGVEMDIETRLLVDKAFALLRAKGFSKYPNLTI